ncbi:hypothetical protein TcCL_NonESM04366 [Trypanosoma cruzi]|nr:hypothetical protein TcCL_NonESM04366 [Trypanosoma cruzi]
MWPQSCLEAVERPQGTAFVFIRGSVTGEKCGPFRHLTFRCLLTPYSVSPWVLSGAPAFYWMIGAAEMWRVFAAPSFLVYLSHAVFEMVFDCRIAWGAARRCIMPRDCVVGAVRWKYLTSLKCPWRVGWRSSGAGDH